MIYRKKHSAFSLIEIIIAISLFGMVLAASGSYAGFSLASLTEQSDYNRANALASEGLEIIRMLTATDWASFASPTNSLRYWDGQWSFVGENSSEQIGIFNRQIIFDSFCRSASNFPVDCGYGLPDPDSRKVTVLVSWSGWFGERFVKQNSYVVNRR